MRYLLLILITISLLSCETRRDANGRRVEDFAQVCYLGFVFVEAYRPYGYAITQLLDEDGKAVPCSRLVK